MRRLHDSQSAYCCHRLTVCFSTNKDFALFSRVYVILLYMSSAVLLHHIWGKWDTAFSYPQNPAQVKHHILYFPKLIFFHFWEIAYQSVASQSATSTIRIPSYWYSSHLVLAISIFGYASLICNNELTSRSKVFSSLMSSDT